MLFCTAFPRCLTRNEKICLMRRDVPYIRLILILLLCRVLGSAVTAGAQTRTPLTLPWEAVFADSTALHAPPWCGDVSYVSRFDMEADYMTFSPVTQGQEPREQVTLFMPLKYTPELTIYGALYPNFIPSPNKTFSMLLYPVEIVRPDYQLWVAFMNDVQGGFPGLALAAVEFSAHRYTILEHEVLVQDVEPWPKGGGDLLRFRITYQHGSGWSLWLYGRSNTNFHLAGSSDRVIMPAEAPQDYTGLHLQYTGSAYSSQKGNNVGLVSLGVYPQALPPGSDWSEGNSTLLLNEVYAHAHTDAAEYIEVINPTPYPIDLFGYGIATEPFSERDVVVPLCNQSRILPPGACIALTRNPEALVRHFGAPADSVLSVPDLPRLPDAGVPVWLVHRLENIAVDYLEYTPALLGTGNSNAAIALERFILTPGLAPQKAWGAALAQYRYGTPGTTNSLVLEEDTRPDDHPGDEDPNEGENNGSDTPDTIRYEGDALCLNELLFHPLAGGSEFIEVYNRSDAPVALQDYVLALRRDGRIYSRIPLAEVQAPPIPPGAYRVLTADAAYFAAHYGVAQELVCSVPKFPRLNDNGGNLLLLSAARDSIVEELTYSPDLYPSGIKSTGTSWERVDVRRAAHDPGNWGACTQEAESENQDCCTPAAINSRAPKSFFDANQNEWERARTQRYTPLQLAQRVLQTLREDAPEATTLLLDWQGNRLALLARQETLQWCTEMTSSGASPLLQRYCPLGHSALLLVQLVDPQGKRHRYAALYQ